MSSLTRKKCAPCEGGMPPLSKKDVGKYLPNVPGWELDSKLPNKIWREFKWKNFKEAMRFVNKVAEIAETEGHHPDISIHGFNKVRLELYTHAVGGLSLNDFIVAAKSNALL